MKKDTTQAKQSEEFDFSLELIINGIKDKTRLTDLGIILSFMLWFSVLNRNIIFELKEDAFNALLLSFSVLLVPFGLILISRFFISPLIDKQPNKVSKLIQNIALITFGILLSFITTILSLSFHNIVIFNMGVFEAFTKESHLSFPNVDSIEVLFMIIVTILVPMLTVNLKAAIEPTK
jgi:hypothetical protein